MLSQSIALSVAQVCVKLSHRRAIEDSENSLDTTRNGEPVPEGALVRAYEPDGVLCGQATVHSPGQWGVMHVYGDDPETPDDEGARDGDVLVLTIDGHSASAQNPVVWSDRGLLQIVLSSDKNETAVHLPMVWR